MSRTKSICILIAAAITAVLPRPAQADAWPALLRPPDRGDHSYCFSTSAPMNNVLHDRAEMSMDTVEAQTVVHTVRRSSCGASTDVTFKQTYLGEGVFGNTSCLALNSNNYCDRHRVRISWSEIQLQATRDNYQARKTLCHETGHTLGLDHYRIDYSRSDRHDCMRSGVYDSGSETYQTYSNHHVGHVNSWWS